MSPLTFLQRPMRWLEAVSRYGATTSGGPNFAYELCARKATPDDVAKLDEVEQEAREVLRQNLAELIEIAHRLVASTFFFEKDVASVKQNAQGFTCTGKRTLL